MKPKCILICVGSELLRGKLNTHASHLSRRLASIGLSLDEENTVPDELPEITRALQRAVDRFDIVVASGGLGPTFDDVTREAAAEATGRPLVLSPALQRNIRAKFRRARYRMPPTNTRQAYLLEGATAIPNQVGTAPGQWLELPAMSDEQRATRTNPKDHSLLIAHRSLLILLPGPPRELYPMLESAVLPRLRKMFPQPPRAEAHLHFVGVPESVIDHKIRPIIAPYSKPHPQPLSHGERGDPRRGWVRQGVDVQFTILAHLGLVDFDVFVTSATAAQARRTLQRIVTAIRRKVGSAWYGSDQDYPLEKVVGDRLRRKRATLAVAESCTGGLLASRLTDIPGSSDYFVEGWVTYANAAKLLELGVPASLLKRFGAVSRPVALAMAHGIRNRAGTTYGIGITGIAGPSGGTPQKPVGLVYVAMASPKGAVCRECRFTGDRHAIRQRSVLVALDLLRRV